MSFLQLKVPPALVFLIFGTFLWAISTYVPSLNISIKGDQWLFGVFAVAGGLAIFSGLYELQRVKTTVDPLKPETASSVVSSGIYRVSRNPIYLGMLLMLMAFAIVRLNILSPLLVIGFILYMNRFQIIPEEKALADKFGDDYLEYKQSVRRWV